MAKTAEAKPPAEDVEIRSITGGYRVRWKRIGHGWEQSDLTTHDAVADLTRRLLMPRDR